MKNHHCPHQHVSTQESLRQIQEEIALQGFALRHVLPDDEEPGYSSTVGLHTPGSSRPEFFISGLSVATRVALLLDLGFCVQGPPPLKTCFTGKQHLLFDPQDTRIACPCNSYRPISHDNRSSSFLFPGYSPQ